LGQSDGCELIFPNRKVVETFYVLIVSNNEKVNYGSDDHSGSSRRTSS
jgi:hypothetical protein